MNIEKNTRFKKLQWLLHKSIEINGMDHKHTIFLSQELDKVAVEMQMEINNRGRETER